MGVKPLYYFYDGKTFSFCVRNHVSVNLQEQRQARDIIILVANASLNDCSNLFISDGRQIQFHETPEI